MRLFSLAAIGLLLFGTAGAARADGLYHSAKDAPPAPSPCCTASWGGFYVSGSVGYGIASSEISHDIAVDDDDFSQNDDIASDGATGTIAVGYDRELSSVVIGVFADYTFGDLEGSGTLTGPDDYTLSYDLDLKESWAVGARLGLTRSCCTMWYVTAGYTATEIEFAGDLSEDLDGYFVGLGVEQQIRAGWSMKLEYRYSDYEDVTLFDETTTACGTSCSQRIDAETDVHAVRFGIAYKFGSRHHAEAPLK